MFVTLSNPKTIGFYVAFFPLFIDQTGGITIAQLSARARKLKRQRGLDLLIVEGIVEAEHRLGMRNLGQMRSRGRPNQLRRRIGTNEVRELGFKFIVAFDQRIIIRIADLGRILGVIAQRMIGDRARETLKFGGGFSFGDHWSGALPNRAHSLG